MVVNKMEIGQTFRLADPATLSRTNIPPEFAGEEVIVVDKNITGHYSIEILSNPGYYFDITDIETLTTEVK